MDSTVFSWWLLVGFLLSNSLPKASTTSSGMTGNLQYLYSRVSPAIQEALANEVLQDLFPERFDEFRVLVDPSLTTSNYEDAFEIKWENNTEKVVVIGTTGVSTLFGLNYYLKYFCNIHISWEGSQLHLPSKLPIPVNPVRKNILDRFRYYQNVCTDSYSFVWWDWERWKLEIDWMALNGINLPLAITGQEAIWKNVYLKLGLSNKDIQEYISGPAFLAWWRMGNLQKWGGPIPESYLERKLELLRKILKRMRNFGMLPVLPAFSGNIPKAMMNLYPNATYHHHPSWNNFNSSYSETYMLDPTDPLFIKIGKLFIDELIQEVGTDHIYNCDAFNENRPSQNTTTFLRAVSKATFKSMIAGDPKAVWMMQGWVFTDFEFWTKDRVRSYLGGVDIGNVIVLDLQAESLPLFIALDSFFNHTFIWCMLHNFGGTMNLYGNMDSINKMLPMARQDSENGTLIGIGLTPEGINQNYVMYDFMTEMTLYSQPIDTKAWIVNYTTRRYGLNSTFLVNAWKILQSGVYNNVVPGFRNHGHTVLTDRPRTDYKTSFWYNPEDISTVVGYFLEEGNSPNSTALNSNLYFHDLVDFTRQFLNHLGDFIYKDLMDAYNIEDIETFWKHAAEMLLIYDDLESILATNDNFLLGKWIESAELWSNNTTEKELLRYNSLAQITIWGPSGEIIDYATKQWAGIASLYYKERWAVFLDTLEASLLSHQPFNKTECNNRILQEVEIPFPKLTSYFPVMSTGNSFTEALRIFQKWKPRYVTAAKQFKMVQRTKRNFDDPKMVYGSLSKLRRLVKVHKIKPKRSSFLIHKSRILFTNNLNIPLIIPIYY